jgi:hypothetical protein
MKSSYVVQKAIQMPDVWQEIRYKDLEEIKKPLPGGEI